MVEFSQDVRDLIEATKQVAIKLDNNYIGVGHFFLSMNKYNRGGKLNIKVSFGDKRDWINELKGKKLDGIKDGEYRLTSQLEEALKSSRFHCKILRDSEIQVEHIYLGILTSEGRNRAEYVNIIAEQDRRINKLESFLISIYFNNFCRKLGLLKLIM